MKNIDALVRNFAPDSDTITIQIGDWTVTIDREDDGTVFVSVEDGDTSARYILGEDNETQRV